MTRKNRLGGCAFAVIGIFLCVLTSSNVEAAERQWPILKQQVEQKIKDNLPAEALQMLIENENAFSGEIDYDYLLGVLSLEYGDLSVAEIALERVVLVDPSHAGAWLDLAIVNFRQGDLVTAQQIIDYLDNNFSPPSHLRQELASVKAKIETTQSKNRAWHGMAGLSFGYDNNANYGLSTDTLALTPLGGLPIIMQLDQSHHQKGDFAGQFKANVTRHFDYENGAESQLMMQALGKKYAEQADFDLFDINLAWQQILPLGVEKRWYFSFIPTARYISLGGQALGEVFTGSAGLFHKKYGCDWGLSLDFEKRLYARFNYIDTSIPWISAVSACQGPQASYGATLRMGVDMPDGKRAGGTTDKKEANIFWRQAIHDDIVVGVMLYVADYEDREGYSPLISRGEQRDLLRLSQKIDFNYQIPAFRNWWLRAEFEHIHDHSNVSLSNIEDIQGYLGVRYNF